MPQACLESSFPATPTRTSVRARGLGATADTPGRREERSPADAVGCTDSLGQLERHGKRECRDGTLILNYAEDLWTEDLVVVEGDPDQHTAAADECLGTG